MKNMKMKMKLIISFFIVIILAGLVGVFGIIGMKQISEADRVMYNMNTIALVSLGEVRENIQRQRSLFRNQVIYNANEAEFKTSVTDLATAEKEILGYFDEYSKTITSDEDQINFDKVKDIYLNDFAESKKKMNDYGSVNNTVAAKDTLNNSTIQVGEMTKLLDSMYQWNIDDAQKAVDKNESIYKNNTLLVIIILVIAVVSAIALALYLLVLISSPVRKIAEIMTNVSKSGNYDIDPETEKSIQEMSSHKDETGELSKAFYTLVEVIQAKVETLGIISRGDLTPVIDKTSESDSIGNALSDMVDNLNEMFDEIKSSTSQVAIGSSQIAEGAQSLAQGSTEQASAVEELSGSISDVAGKTKENAEKADNAMNLSNAIMASAEKSSNQMSQMMQAVKEINDASQNINKVIKVIDDIAFQTNILALNAAVEAARAGQHGKGFAVVAEEVRNLAAKSAEAAKDTSDMIVNSIEKAELGSQIAGETSTSLIEIVGEINKIAGIIEEVARSSEQQTIAISQINKGIDQVAQVVQQNSATAEESAASSQEMSGQATILEELVSRFKIKSDLGSSNRRGMTSSSMGSSVRKSSSKPKIELLESNDYGKY